MTPELEKQLNEALNNQYCSKYEKMFISQNDNSLHSWKANHDEVPRFVSDDWFLKLKITDAAA